MDTFINTETSYKQIYFWGKHTNWKKKLNRANKHIVYNKRKKVFVKKSNSSSVAPCLRDARCRICVCFCIPFYFYFVHGFSSFLQPLFSFHPRSTLIILTSDISKLLLMLCFLGNLLTFSVSNDTQTNNRNGWKNNINEIKLFRKNIRIFFTQLMFQYCLLNK